MSSSMGVMVIHGCSTFMGASWSSGALNVHEWGSLLSMGVVIIHGHSRYVVGVVRGCLRFGGRVSVGGCGCPWGIMLICLRAVMVVHVWVVVVVHGHCGRVCGCCVHLGEDAADGVPVESGMWGPNSA